MFAEWGAAPHIHRLSRLHSPFHPLPVFENDLLRGTSAERSWWPREVNTLSQVTQKDTDGDKTGTQVWGTQATAISQIPQFT